MVDETKLMLGTYDCIFKAIMLDKNNIDYLKELIHYITKIPMIDLRNIEVVNSEHIVDNKKDKKMRSDIIINVGNRVINLEMNREYYEGIFAKNNAYLQKIASNLYIEGEDYLTAKSVIQINFDNFSHFPGEQEIYKFIYKEDKINIILPDNPIKYHIDLAYIRKKCYNKPVVNLSKFERYCLLLMADTKKFAKNVAGDDKIMKKVTKKLEELNQDKNIIGLYNAEIEDAKIMRTKLKYAEKTGMERGMERGMAQGLEKGMEKGIICGIKQEKMQIAKNMLSKNMDINLIVELTNLSFEEIDSLK